MIAKSHGEHVQLVRTDTATGRTTVRDAILRTGPDGIVLDVDGTTEALNCSGLDKAGPPSCAPRAGRRAATFDDRPRGDGWQIHRQLSYLALGIDRSADYVARIDPDDRTSTLTGWLTLVNRAGTTFANTPAEVVAGRLARDEEETQPPGPTTTEEGTRCWPIGTFGMSTRNADAGIQARRR